MTWDDNTFCKYLLTTFNVDYIQWIWEPYTFTYYKFYRNYFIILLQEFIYYHFFWCIKYDHYFWVYRSLWRNYSWSLWLFWHFLNHLKYIIFDVIPYVFYFTWGIIMPELANFYLVDFYFEKFYPFFLKMKKNLFLLRWIVILLTWTFKVIVHFIFIQSPLVLKKLRELDDESLRYWFLEDCYIFLNES